MVIRATTRGVPGDTGMATVEYLTLALVTALVSSLAATLLVVSMPTVRVGAGAAVCEVFDAAGCPEPEPGPGSDGGGAVTAAGGPAGVLPGSLTDMATSGVVLSGVGMASLQELGVSSHGATWEDIVATEVDVTGVSWARLREWGVMPGSVNLWDFAAAGGDVTGASTADLAGFFDVVSPDGDPVPLEVWRGAGITCSRADGSAQPFSDLARIADVSGVSLRALTDPGSGVDVSGLSLLDLLREGVVPDLDVQALRSKGLTFTGVSVADLRAAGVADGTLDAQGFLALEGSVAGLSYDEVVDFFRVTPEGQRLPFGVLRQAGVVFRGADGVAPRLESLTGVVDFTGVPLSVLADPGIGIDVSDRAFTDFVDNGIVVDVGTDSLSSWGVTGWEPQQAAESPAAESPAAEASAAETAAGLGEATSLLAAFRDNGLITAEQYEAYLADPTFLAGLGDVLARGGGVAVWDSPGQVFVDQILATSAPQLTEILTRPVDLSTGPETDQMLALYALAGTSDRAFQELAVNWLFTRYPDLELMYDAGSDSFGWYVGDERQSTPFLDSLIANLSPLDIEDKLEAVVMGERGDNGRDGDTSFCRSASVTYTVGDNDRSRSGCGWTGSNGDAPDREFHGRFSVRPMFEAVNAHRTADLNGDRVREVAPILGLETTASGSFGIPGDPRFGFDIDDNRVEKRDGDNADAHDLLIREVLGQVDPGLLQGSDHVAVNAADATVTGGFGDDSLLAVNSQVSADLGGGVNTTVATDGTELTYVDSHGDDVVMTVGVTGGLPGADVGVDVALVDDATAYQGNVSVLLGEDGAFTADLDEAGTRNVVVAEGVTIDASGGVVSTADGGRESIVNAGTLTGDGGPLSVIDLGPGPDALTTTSGSTLTDLRVGLGGGDDTGDLAGVLDEVQVDLGDDNDLLLVRDTVTGDVVVVDPESSWMWAGDDDVEENDQLLLVGDGFAEVDPDDPGAGIRRLAADGATVASIGFDGDPERVELIAVIGPDGRIVEDFQAIDPEVRQRAAWLGVLSDVVKIAGIATGQVYLTAAAVAMDGVHTAVNGGDAFDVAVSTGTGIAGAVTGLDWVVPAGSSITSAFDGDWDTAVLNGLTAIGGGAGIPDLANAAAATTGVLNSVDAWAQGDVLGVVQGLVAATDAATGTTDQATYNRILTSTGVVQALATLDVDSLDDYTALAVAATEAADTFGTFDPPPVLGDLDNTVATDLTEGDVVGGSPPDGGASPGKEGAESLPDVPLAPDSLYANVWFPESDTPGLGLAPGRMREYTIEDRTWRIQNNGEVTDSDGMTRRASLRYEKLDESGGGVSYTPSTEPYVHTHNDTEWLVETRIVRSSPDGTWHDIERTWTPIDESTIDQVVPRERRSTSPYTNWRTLLRDACIAAYFVCTGGGAPEGLNPYNPKLIVPPAVVQQQRKEEREGDTTPDPPGTEPEPQTTAPDDDIVRAPAVGDDAPGPTPTAGPTALPELGRPPLPDLSRTPLPTLTPREQEEDLVGEDVGDEEERRYLPPLEEDEDEDADDSFWWVRDVGEGLGVGLGWILQQLQRNWQPAP